MQAPTTGNGRLLCQEHDRITIPADVPALGVRKGDEGIVRNLELYNETVFAFVTITYSTGQTKGWVIIDGIAPHGMWSLFYGMRRHMKISSAVSIPISSNSKP